MTDEKTTQDVHLKGLPIPLKYEATGEFRPPLSGDLYLDEYGHVKSALVDWPNKCCIILRKREPQPGSLEEEWEAGEPCRFCDLTTKYFTGACVSWSVSWNVKRFDDDIVFPLRPKAKPSLSVRVRSWMPRAKTRTSHTACITDDELSALADDIEAREKVIAEVVKDLRDVGCKNGTMQRWADKLEGKE